MTINQLFNIVTDRQKQFPLVSKDSQITALTVLQGRIKANVMHGQALHFRWGDGAKFGCKELTQCFKDGYIRKKG